MITGGVLACRRPFFFLSFLFFPNIILLLLFPWMGPGGVGGPVLLGRVVPRRGSNNLARLFPSTSFCLQTIHLSLQPPSYSFNSSSTISSSVVGELNSSWNNPPSLSPSFLVTLLSFIRSLLSLYLVASIPHCYKHTLMDGCKTTFLVMSDETNSALLQLICRLQWVRR